jgi:lipopolysaccharide biosynthesis regulator YciM
VIEYRFVSFALYVQQRAVDVARRLLIAGISNFPNSRNIGWFHCALGNLAKEDNDINTARACYDRALDATSPHKSLAVILEYARMEATMGEVTN